MCNHGSISVKKGQALHNLGALICQQNSETHPQHSQHRRNQNNFLHPKVRHPQGQAQDVTYEWIIVSYRQQKTEKHQLRLTAGGDRLNYLFDVSTPTSGLSTIKLLWNSALSTPGAKLFSLDVAIFLLENTDEMPQIHAPPPQYNPQRNKNCLQPQKLVKDRWV